MRFLLNSLQRQKTILILNDSNTLPLSINGNCSEVSFIYMVLVVLWNKGILRTSEKGKNWVTSEA